MKGQPDGPRAHRGEGTGASALPDYSTAIVQTVREPLVLLDTGLRVLVANAAFYRVFGGSPSDTRRRSIFDLADGRWDAPGLHTVLRTLQERDVAFEDYEVEVTVDGKSQVYQLNARKLASPQRDDSILLLEFQDITESLRVEERLRDMARMEAVGQLAGGVAHEINNHMTVLMGYMAFVTRDMPPDHPKRPDLHRAEQAAEHVVYITRQLLNFSRKQMIKRELLDPWTLATGLGRMLGSNIELELVREGDIRSVDVDPGQLGEVFVNLALNARYAMEGAGHFRIALSTVEIQAGDAGRSPAQPPGRYVRFEISDTGPGMDEPVMRRVFEPFFTTKPLGEGTGLGLASVFGTVTQHGGFIRVESQLGIGTRFTIELPEVEPVSTEEVAGTPAEPMPRGGETILVAEDEVGVRDWIGRVLRECGYTVLEAEDGTEGLRLLADHADSVRLVLTDLVMPGAGGREIGERMAANAPHVSLLYMSSYAGEEIERRHLVGPAGGLMRKRSPRWCWRSGFGPRSTGSVPTVEPALREMNCPVHR